MSKTNWQKLRDRKRAARRKGISKRRNEQLNAQKKRLRLEVWTPDGYKVERRWRTDEAANAHIRETEKLREAGIGIVDAIIIDERSGRVIHKIKGSKAKGDAPDKIADGVVAEAPGEKAGATPKGHGKEKKGSGFFQFFRKSRNTKAGNQ